MPALIGLDLGTTTIKAAAYDPDTGELIRLAQQPTPTIHPRPEWSEHDPEKVWTAAAACLREASDGLAVLGMGVSSLSEAGVPLGAAMRPLYPAIAWYDRRTLPQVAWWEERTTLEEVHAITGQRVNPSHGVNKLLWLLENIPGLRGKLQHWLNLPDYLLWRLTGAIGTDPTLASRTMLYDQQAGAWSEHMLDLAGLEASLLPPILPGGSLIGRVTREGALATGLPVGLPCAVAGHDHLVGAFALGLADGGTVIDSCGTAQASLMLTPRFMTSPDLARQAYACYAFALPGQYVLKGGNKSAGQAIEWVARMLSGVSEPNYAALEAEARVGAGSKAGPLWLPHFNGAGTPESDRAALAALVGAKVEHTRGDLFRGILEGMAMSLRRDLDQMAAIRGEPFSRVILTGGAARISLLDQVKADALNQPVALSGIAEASATGAALMGGLAAGVFATPAEAVASVKQDARPLTPDPGRAAFYDRLYHDVYAPLYERLQETNAAINSLNDLASPPA